MRITKVITNNTRPQCQKRRDIGSPKASANSFARVAEMVVPGARRETLRRCAFPMTNVTAMVSPSARPSPSIIAPIRLVFVKGIKILRHTSPTLAPVPYAARRSEAGTVRKRLQTYRRYKRQNHDAQNESGSKRSDAEGRTLKKNADIGNMAKMFNHRGLNEVGHYGTMTNRPTFRR